MLVLNILINSFCDIASPTRTQRLWECSVPFWPPCPPHRLLPESMGKPSQPTAFQVHILPARTELRSKMYRVNPGCHQFTKPGWWGTQVSYNVVNSDDKQDGRWDMRQHLNGAPSCLDSGVLGPAQMVGIASSTLLVRTEWMTMQGTNLTGLRHRWGPCHSPGTLEESLLGPWNSTRCWPSPSHAPPCMYARGSLRHYSHLIPVVFAQ